MFVKLKKILKNKKTMFIIGLILGLISVPLVYAANTIYAKNVTYYNFNSGLSATNVQDAIDETYDRCAPNTLLSVIKKGATLDTNIDIDSPTTGDTNGKGVYIREGTEDDTNPVYYYRGAVTNNNLIFADTCWKIVRTTETGGVKLLYNGVPSANGTCNNTGEDSMIGESAFNSDADLFSNFGYMYGKSYDHNEVDLSKVTDTYYYGNDVTYSNGRYTLTNSVSSNDISSIYDELDTHHYTCLGNTTSCSTVYYIYYMSNEYYRAHYIELTGGEKIEDAVSDMLDTNTTSSTIKTVVDDWYRSNIANTGYSDYIEDTVWCNDRNLNYLHGFNPDGDISYYSYDFGIDKLSCERKEDSFTMSKKNGNGALNYPVGLLTYYETKLAGSGSGSVISSVSSSDSYIINGNSWWTMTPDQSDMDEITTEIMGSTIVMAIYYDYLYRMNSDGIDYPGGMPSMAIGVRPSISIKSGAMITGGDGTVDKPYTISYESGGDDSSSSKATDKIINLYNDGSSINTVNIGGDTSNPEVKLNATQGIMLDNNGDYRYYGANPNNYVEFNDETWRIIGAFNNVDDGTGNKETRLKIIRDESIGSYSWDSSASTVNSGYGVNDWSKADLMTELNTLYYNSTSGTCYNGQNNASTTCDFTSTGLDSTARGMIDNAVYHLGGSSTYSIYADDFYNYERGTTVYNCSTNDGACPRATTWTGKIGLMYPSDYAYAVDLSLCTQNGKNYNNSTCTSNDWLYLSSYEWTIMPASSSASRAFFVMSTGYVSNLFGVYGAYAARPVLYLKSNVTITGGTGTSSYPYQLSL